MATATKRKKTTKKPAKEKTPRKRTAKQQHFNGMEPKRIAAIEIAAEDYVAVRDERMELTEDEFGQREKLAELMKKYKLEKYKCHDVKLEVVVKHGEDSVKVKRVKEKEPETENV